MKPDGHFSADDVFGALSHNRRRLALQYFKQVENPIDIDALAEGIARWEQTPAAVPADVEIDAVHTALHKTHLPKLDELGFIEYQADTETILTDETRITGAMENCITVIEFLYYGAAPREDVS